jgi:hypothetical protein
LRDFGVELGSNGFDALHLGLGEHLVVLEGYSPLD